VSGPERKEKTMRDGDNGAGGFHSKHRVNQPTSTDAGQRAPFAKTVSWGSEMGPGILGAPKSVAPHGSTDKLAPHLGAHDRNLTDHSDDLKYGANHLPSGRK
jgi:hypothetical protein